LLLYTLAEKARTGKINALNFLNFFEQQSAEEQSKQTEPRVQQNVAGDVAWKQNRRHARSE